VQDDTEHSVSEQGSLLYFPEHIHPKHLHCENQYWLQSPLRRCLPLLLNCHSHILCILQFPYISLLQTFK